LLSPPLASPSLFFLLLFSQMLWQCFVARIIC
jgi:hypothetical protein